MNGLYQVEKSNEFNDVCVAKNSERIAHFLLKECNIMKKWYAILDLIFSIHKVKNCISMTDSYIQILETRQNPVYL